LSCRNRFFEDGENVTKVDDLEFGAKLAKGGVIEDNQRKVTNVTGRTIYITNADMKRLRPLVEQLKDSRDDLRMLQKELERARVVEEVPVDVVTMHSKVRVRDVGMNTVLATYTLVFPDEANIKEDKISVVTPIGAAMLGQHVGDEFEWQASDGPVRLQVEEVVYESAAAGHSHV
jgi:regulator of nucleoside diphosphate kinase